MIQLVVSGNRIVAHGEDCFLSMCGTVVCTATGRVFQNATVVNHDGAIPCDLDQVGYEYHAGEFVPCAPFGVGTGNFLVACDDCKTIKDSGIRLSQIGKVAVVESRGGGSVTVDFEPQFALIYRSDNTGGVDDMGIATPGYGFKWKNGVVSEMNSSRNGNTLTFDCGSRDVLYTIVVVGGVG